MAQRGAARSRRRAHVHAVHPVPGVERTVGQRLPNETARDIDHAVQSTQPLDHVGIGGTHRAFVGKVHARRRDVLVLRGRVGHVDHRDAVASPGQAGHDRLPQNAETARDDDACHDLFSIPCIRRPLPATRQHVAASETVPTRSARNHVQRQQGAWPQSVGAGGQPRPEGVGTCGEHLRADALAPIGIAAELAAP